LGGKDVYIARRMEGQQRVKCWPDFMAIEEKIFYNARRFNLHLKILPKICSGYSL